MEVNNVTPEVAKKAKKRKKKDQEDNEIVEKKKSKNDSILADTWDEDADKLLIDLVEQNFTRANRPKFIYPKHIQWGLVATKVSAERNLNVDKNGVRARWDELAKDVRKLRTVPEITEDIKRNLQFHFNTMPKRPSSAYQHFWLSKKDSIKKKYPEMSLPELSKRLGKKWRELPADKKVKYEKRAKDKMNEYMAELEKWKQDNPASLEEMGEGKSKNKPSKAANSKKVSPFEIFCEQKSGDVKEKYPDLDEEGLKSKLTKRWEKLKDHKKDKFTEEAKKINEARKGTSEKGKKTPAKKRASLPLNPYSLFFKDERLKLLKENPKLSFGEIAGMVGKGWKVLEAEKVEEYKQKATELKQKFVDEHANNETKKNEVNKENES